MNLEELLNKKENLHPELQERFYTTPFACIKHPLIYSMMHSEQLNAFVNAQFDFKKRKACEALKQKDYSQYVFLHERP